MVYGMYTVCGCISHLLVEHSVCNLCLLEVSKASMPEFCLGRCRIRVWVRPSRFQCCSSQMSKPHGQESISFPTLGIWPPRSLAGCLLTQTESLFTQCVKLVSPTPTHSYTFREEMGNGKWEVPSGDIPGPTDWVQRRGCAGGTLQEFPCSTAISASFPGIG
jgi:hypothetical protein